MHQGHIILHKPIPFSLTTSHEFSSLEEKFFILLQKNKAEQAAKIFEGFYQTMLTQQPSGKRFSKGGVLYNIALGQLFAGYSLGALKNYLRSYIEDYLDRTTATGIPADNAPAAVALKAFFKMTPEMFEALKSFIDGIMGDTFISNPEVILEKFLQTTYGKRLQKDAVKVSISIKQQIYSISKLPGLWEKRVFVGGDYKRLDTLNTIKKYVEKLGYTPIIALEFKIPPEYIHHHSLLLLHNCRYAIFDITTRSGQLMEAERIFDYHTKTLFVCEARAMSELSAMLKTLGEEIYYFDKEKNLEEKITKFLL